MDGHHVKKGVDAGAFGSVVGSIRDALQLLQNGMDGCKVELCSSATLAPIALKWPSRGSRFVRIL